MKSFTALVLVSVFVTVLCDKPVEWAENAKVCTQKNNVTEDDVKKVMSGETKAADVTSNLKCFFLCMSEMEGVTKNGVFQPAALAEKIANSPHKEEITKAIAACKDTKGTDNCDTAYKFMACMAQFKPKHA